MTDSKIAKKLSPRTLNRAQLNIIMRFSLLMVIAIAVILTILAARPPLRYFGDYPAALNTPNAIYGASNAVVAYVTVSQVAIVIFPKEWQRSDAVCLAVQVARTATPTQPDFNDYVPQSRWNDPFSGILAIDTQTIRAHTTNGGTMLLMNNDLAGLISERTPYQVQWFGQEAVTIAPDQAAGGLLCAHFLFIDGEARIPPFFYLNIGVRNAYVASQPAFYFSYRDVVPTGKHPASTVELTTISVADYLAGLLVDASFAVQLQKGR